MGDLSLSILLFLLMHLFVFWSSNTLVFRFFSSEVRDALDWFILVFVLFVSQILGMLFLLGVFDALFFWPVFFLSLAVFLLCFFVFDGAASAHKLRKLLAKTSGMWKEQGFLGIYGFLIVYGLIELFNALVQYPWEYDSISYHMPFVVEWLQKGSLREVFYSVWGGPLGYYPSHHELLSFWMVLPFGNDYLVNTVNFGFVVVLMVLIFKILREMRVSVFLSWLSGALVLVMPIFLRQIGTSQVDIFMTLGLMLSWYYLFRSFKRNDGLLYVPFLLSFSLLLGVKYLSLIYALPVLLVFLLMQRNWKKASRFWWVQGIFVLSFLGGFWYFRNLFLSGNPVFPAEVALGDMVLFRGYENLSDRIQGLSLWSRFEEDPSVFWVWLSTMIGEAGWQVYLVVLAYALLLFEFLHKLLFRKLSRGEGKIFSILAFLLPAYWYLYFIAPYTASMMVHNVRYAMPWLVLAMVLVSYSVDKIHHLKKVFIIGLIAVVWWEFLSLVTSLRAGEQRFMDIMWIESYQWLFWAMLGIVALSFLYFEGWRMKRWWRHSVLVLLILSFFWFGDHINSARRELRAQAWQLKYHFPLFQAYEVLDTLVKDDEAVVIANTLNPLYYPLYGPELKRRVLYVNINDCFACDYADYHRRTETVRSHEDYWVWKDHLERHRVSYLVAGYSIPDGLEDLPPYEIQWAEWHPEHFTRVFDQHGVKMYRFHTAPKRLSDGS